MDNPKQWWTPLWTGLVMDRQAKHYHRMRNAIWLYLYFLLTADRQAGTLKRKINTMCSDLGQSRDTVNRWMGILRRNKYITARTTGRYLLIQVCNWKGVGDVGKTPHRIQDKCHNRSRKNPTPYPNDTNNKNNILKVDIDNNKYLSMKSKANKDFKPNDKYELLAMDLASSLNDIQALPLYISYAKQFPPSLLLRTLAQVKELPAASIKKSRGALFNYLIQKHAQENSENTSH